MRRLASSLFIIGWAAAATIGLPIRSAISGESAAAEAQVLVAQACGWYTIYSCSRSRGEARRFSNEYGRGYVIDTNDSDYPNFRGDYYCVVEGPMSRGAALSDAKRARDFAPSAYAKNAC